MIQNIVQLKEMGRVKELNEILFSLPIGLKYNLTLMPIIYKSVLESLQNKQEIKGMSTLQ